MIDRSPQKSDRKDKKEGPNLYITVLSRQWNLNIEPHREGDSPRKRRIRAVTANEECAERCVSKISHLWYQDQERLELAIREFENEARELHKGWVYKPKADFDLLPTSSSTHSLLSLPHRLELLECLYRHVLHHSDEVKRVSISRRSLSRSTSLADEGTTTCPSSPVKLEPTLVPEASGEQAALATGIKEYRRSKRRSDGDGQLNDSFKKPKLPSTNERVSQTVVDPIDNVPTKTHAVSSIHQGSNQLFFPQIEILDKAMQADCSRSKTSLEGSSAEVQKSVKGLNSANTSFDSHASSVFSHNSRENAPLDTSFDGTEIEEHHPSTSTKYGSELSDENYFDAVLTQPLLDYEIEDHILPMEDPQTLEPDVAASLQAITGRLSNTFPELPSSLERLSLPIRYEITRVFQHAGVPLDNIETPDNSSEGPIFLYQLQPLKTDTTHRLGRRFGHDRFLEVIIPSLSLRHLPKNFTNAGFHGRQSIVKWIVHSVHKILGVDWKAFYVKESKGRRVEKDPLEVSEPSSAPASRVFFFATGGLGFQNARTGTQRNEDSIGDTAMSVTAMLNWLIPLSENEKEPFLKLFSRISLGLSKTFPTVVFSPSKIRYQKQDLRSSKGEVMNDGCGEISFLTALNIVGKLGLNQVPSGFQARIGEAKGFWLVNYERQKDEEWIEIYPSQCKWKMSRAIIDNISDDHRTFEVVKWVTPLRAADLNLQFLPIIEDRSISRHDMRKYTARLLENGLTYEISRQRSAMDSPYSFRLWARDNNNGIQERIKHGQVEFKAGLPVSLEERLNLLLDAGFDPKRLAYLMEVARRSYTSKCQVLKKKLNITVGRSTYAYMVVDFRGILEPDEVHLGFSSSFKDEISGFNEVFLHGVDVLVARSPAHYVSDIQRVRAVFKLELRELKDVIVFSSRGSGPLAQKLSGGDYDGDIAWVCWEPSLVNNFQNADIPICPDLVKMGHVEKESRTYADLMCDSSDPNASFLEYSFDFNLQENHLGICTSYKERLCYARNNVRDGDAVFLSTLLGLLVDQAKQGYNLTPAAWHTIRKEVIKFEGQEPAYKGDERPRRPVHIIDYLKFVVAHETIEKTLTDFHQTLKEASQWDEDLVKFAQWAEGQAKENSEWAKIMAKLKTDIDEVKTSWNSNFNVREKGNDELNAVVSTALHVYDQWLEVLPAGKTSLTHLLLLPFIQDPELTYWSLLRASVCFKCYHKSNFVWRMAGKQLCHLKTLSGRGGMRTITEGMYAMLRPDSTFVKLMSTEEHEPRFYEARAESEMKVDGSRDADIFDD